MNVQRALYVNGMGTFFWRQLYILQSMTTLLGTNCVKYPIYTGRKACQHGKARHWLFCKCKHWRCRAVPCHVGWHALRKCADTPWHSTAWRFSAYSRQPKWVVPTIKIYFLGTLGNFTILLGSNVSQKPLDFNLTWVLSARFEARSKKTKKHHQQYMMHECLLSWSPLPKP